MVYKFLIISDEVDNFLREIKIDSESSFLDLQSAILESVGYTKDQITSFFLCDDDWNKQTEITLVEMDSSSDIDIYLMEDTKLEELLEDEKQKLIFVFDYLTERCFFMELRSIVPGESLEVAECVNAREKAPLQVLPIEEFEAKQEKAALMLDDEEFFGQEEFDINDIDKDGFEGFSNESFAENPFDDGF